MKSRRRITALKAQDHADAGRLHQGFASSEMGFSDQFARQQSWVAHVRFGSEADIEAPPPDVRFTPNSGHQLTALGCPLSANSGLSGPLNFGIRPPKKRTVS